MKHIITLVVVTAFTMTAALAGEQCCQDKAKAAAEAKAKAAKSDGSVKGAQQLVKVAKK